VAEWLTAARYPTSLEAVKNAGREIARLVEASVAATEKTIALLAVILGDYPDFEFERAFVSGHVAKVRADPRIARILKRALPSPDRAGGAGAPAIGEIAARTAAFTTFE